LSINLNINEQKHKIKMSNWECEHCSHINSKYDEELECFKCGHTRTKSAHIVADDKSWDCVNCSEIVNKEDTECPVCGQLQSENVIDDYDTDDEEGSAFYSDSDSGSESESESDDKSNKKTNVVESETESDDTDSDTDSDSD
jgi:hypothetical protein